MSDVKTLERKPQDSQTSTVVEKEDGKHLVVWRGAVKNRKSVGS